MEILHLDHNEFQGEIPFNIGKLTNLKRLWLANNRFQGFLPPSLLQLTRLETLALEFNELQGYVPPELCNLNKLTLLRLDHNDFNGEIPRTFGLLTNLKELELGTGDLGDNDKIENLPVTLDMLTTWRSEPAPDKQKEMSFEQFKEVSSVRMKGLGKNLDESVLKMHYHRTKRAQRWQEMIDKKDPFDNRPEHIKESWNKRTAPGVELSKEEKKAKMLLAKAAKAQQKKAEQERNDGNGEEESGSDEEESGPED